MINLNKNFNSLTWAQIESLISGLDYDRQLKNDPELKRDIKAILNQSLACRTPTQSAIGSTGAGPPCECETENHNPFSPEQSVLEEAPPAPTPPPKTQIEKIRERNRYIK